MRRMILVAVITLVILAVSLLRPNPSPRPHLLLITLDTTRADRLGCYGYRNARTPTLDAIASSGILFERAYTVAPLTLPAHVSLFTGLYPTESGVRRNGRERLAPDIPTLAEILQHHGYDTAAFVGSFVLDRKFGLDRGFHHYDDQVGADGPAGLVEHRRRNASSVVDAAINWLKKRQSGPSFCWVHFYDPHAPRSAHRELFDQEFADQPYDAEIAYVDRQIHRLMEFFDAQKLMPQTLVVIVGDHGEGLGEHFEDSHSLTLYNSVMRVPLIISPPQKHSATRRIEQNISVVDVFPTILDSLKLPLPQQISGKSFRDAFDKNLTIESSCYSATDDPMDVYGCAPLRSLTEGSWKYIRSTRPELFQLSSDPGELVDLFERESEKAQEMEARLAEFEATLVRREQTDVPLSGAERKTLASLGYVSGPANQKVYDEDKTRPDIKDMLVLERDMEQAVRSFNQGAEDEAISGLKGVLLRAPTHAPACWSLAWALWKQSKAEEAENVFRQLLDARPDCHSARYGLGLMELQRNQPESAISEFSKAVELDPEHAESHFHLAEAFLATGRVDQAHAHLKDVLQLAPDNVEAIQLLNFIQSNMKRIDQAVREYQHALQRASQASNQRSGPSTPIFRP